MAPSIKRKLLMQVFFRAVSRALMKFGMAIAARRPMIATTIMISTSVKPALREDLIFMLLLLLSVSGVNEATGGFTYNCIFCSLIARRQTACLNLSTHAANIRYPKA